MTGFEILVSFLQAFIFTILTAVYIGSSMHPYYRPVLPTPIYRTTS